MIQVFITSILTWKLGILDAIQKAADVTEFSVRSVRKWVSGFLQSIDGVQLDDIDDETVTFLLSSEPGKTCKNPGSLINDEEFRLKAREFVECHAYKRGEPNLTADMFNAWMKETYKLEVCSETAQVWLHNLGFSQKKHQRVKRDDVMYRDICSKVGETWIGDVFMTVMNLTCFLMRDH